MSYYPLWVMDMHLRLLLIEKSNKMKRSLLFISVIVLGALLRASNTIVILKAKNFGTFQTKSFVLEHDSIVTLKDTNLIFDTDAFLYENIIVSSSWDKKEEHYNVSFHTSDSIFKQSFSELGFMKAFTNKKKILAIPLTDTEVSCYNDFIDFAILNLPYRGQIYLLVVKNNQVKSNFNKEKFRIAYFDEVPRGAGVDYKNQILKVVDNKSGNVFIVDMLEGLTDMSYEREEFLFVDSTVQWLDNDTFIYMMMKRLDEYKTHLYLYRYNVGMKCRTLIKEILFPYSIEKLKFQLFDRHLYIMNSKGIYIVHENSIQRLLDCNNLIDFYINVSSI